MSVHRICPQSISHENVVLILLCTLVINDFYQRTFNFIARSDAAHVTCSTDMNSWVTCSQKYSFLLNRILLHWLPYIQMS